MIDIIIIGAGFAGLTAAIYAKRSGLNILVIEKGIYGGQVSITNDIENYPAIEKITGPELSTRLYNHAVNIGIDIKFETVTEINLKDNIKTIKTNLNEYKCLSIIIANGVTRRKLECEGENRLTGHGVSYCATCDAAFYKNKPTAIVGGGNTALEDALFLSNNCSKVFLIHRRDTFRGEKVLIDAVKNKKNIEILYNTIVEKINGDKTVESIEINDIKNNIKKTLNLDGIFIAIGLKPENDVFKEQINLDNSGYIISDESCKTNINGVFVAGDTRTKLLRQIITAASDGAISAFQASNYINTKIK